MAFSLPNFNLLADIWDCRVPDDGVADWIIVPCQKYIRSRMSLDVSPQAATGFWKQWTPPIQLRFPRSHSAFFGSPASWTHLVYEVPAGSGQYYRTFWREVQHQGFSNEYAIIVVTPCDSAGKAIAPPGREFGLGVVDEVCPVPPPAVEGWGLYQPRDDGDEMTGMVVENHTATIVAEDDFNDTPGVDLTAHTMDIGDGWLYGAGLTTWAISGSGDSAVMSSMSPGYALAWTMVADHDSAVFGSWIVGDNSGSQIGVSARVQDALNGYVAWWDFDSHLLELGLLVSGAYTSLSNVAIPYSVSSGDVVLVELAIAGSTLSARFNTSPPSFNTTLTATDTTYP